jgi:hypothetical protein
MLHPEFSYTRFPLHYLANEAKKIDSEINDMFFYIDSPVKKFFPILKLLKIFNFCRTFHWWARENNEFNFSVAKFFARAGEIRGVEHGL